MSPFRLSDKRPPNENAKSREIRAVDLLLFPTARLACKLGSEKLPGGAMKTPRRNLIFYSAKSNEPTQPSMIFDFLFADR